MQSSRLAMATDASARASSNLSNSGVMAEAALIHYVPVEQISFKGAVDTLRQYRLRLARARTHKNRCELVAMLLSDLARDRIPHRPDRRQPRAVKRRPKPFALLTKPRQVFKDMPHRDRA